MAFMTLHEAAFEEGKKEGSKEMFEKFVKSFIKKSNGQLNYEEAKKEAEEIIALGEEES